VSKKKLIYLASDVFYKGGIERYSRTQIQVLKEILPEFDISVFSYQPPRDNIFETPFQLDYHGNGSGLFSKIRYSLRVFWDILITNPELVWVNHIHLLPIAYISKLFRGKVKIFLNIYGLEIWSGLKWIEKTALARADKIISDCHFTAKFVIKEFLIPPERISVIWDPVDTNRFIPKEKDYKTLSRRYFLPELDDSLCLMILGRISVGSRHKGFDRLIDLMGDLREEKISLLICGDGDDRTRLESRVLNEGLQERVFFPGIIAEDDLVDVYNLADVFILVSDQGKSRGEGVPLTPLEAASCGKPIIFGNQDGSQEAVREGINGFIVSPDEPDVLKKRIMDLNYDQDLRMRMGNNAREIILEEFSLPVFTSKHQQVLDSMIKFPL